MSNNTQKYEYNFKVMFLGVFMALIAMLKHLN